MEFNQLIKEQFFPILQNEGFEVIEDLKDVIRFNSSNMEIGIVYNDYEKSNLIEIGKRNEILYPLNDNVIVNVFKSELQISQVTTVVFVKNLVSLFTKKEGSEILKGNIKYLVKFIEQEGSRYTFELVQRQTLEAATRAWHNNDYKNFIKSMDAIDIEKAPLSYQLKYKIAKQRL